MSEEKETRPADETGIPVKAEDFAISAEDDGIMKEIPIDTPDAEVEVSVIDDRDKEADQLICWGAARAGAIAAAPFMGTAMLMANEVYMIARIASVYGMRAADSTILSFLGTLSGKMAGSIAAVLIPLPVMQIPIGISVTYGIGRAAKMWIKDGMPDETEPYLEVFQEERDRGAKKVNELKENPQKDIPLGDETKEFEDVEEETNLSVQLHEALKKMGDALTDTAVAAVGKAKDALREMGVSDEQMENAKYTAIGISEVARETAAEAAKDFKSAAKVRAAETRKLAGEKSVEFKEQAAVRSAELKKEAKIKAADLKIKAEEMKRLTGIHAEEARLRAAKTRAQAQVRMEEAKLQAEKIRAQVDEQSMRLKDHAKTQAEAAKGKAAELSEKAQNAAKVTRMAAVNAQADIRESAIQMKEGIRLSAEEFRTKVSERAAQRKNEAGKATETLEENGADSASAENRKDTEE